MSGCVVGRGRQGGGVSAGPGSFFELRALESSAEGRGGARIE